MGALLYFAYGSNMLTARLRERCASARPLGMATLPRYELKWHKRSKDGSGKCDIVESVEGEASVHGVLYEIPDHEKSRLDRAEGLGYGYEQVAIEVSQDGRPVSAVAYVATNVDSTLKPFDWYQAHVVEGAVEHGLPAEYIAGLRAVEVTTSA
jgi:gamma-glutamylcyclotransferase